ncbi:MAG: DUF3465 domain-containing protein [bacterium]|nr:DUF3465 domain-containing protein [bacterium]
MRKGRRVRFLLAAFFSALLSLAPVFSASAAAAAPSPVRQAFVQRQSRVWLRARGEVIRVLKDDLKGSRHQRFIVRLADGLTVLVSHNIDLAARVPVRLGDGVEVFGRYEWSRKGGTIHWTHRGTRGEKPGGWIRHRGALFR